MAKAKQIAPGTLEVTGRFPMNTITNDSDHVLQIGSDTFFCPDCHTDHTIVAIHEDNRGSRDIQENLVLVLDQGEAVEVATYLLHTFGILTMDEWEAASAHISERRALGALNFSRAQA